MTQETASTDAEVTQQTDAVIAAAQQRTDFNSLPADVQEHIRNLTKEAEKNRKDKAAAKAAAEAAELAKLAEKQEWQKVAETLQQRLDAVAPLAEQLATLKQTLADTAQKRIDALPKQWQQAVPEYDDPAKTLQWLDANASLWGQTVIPVTAAGQTGDRSSVPKSVQEALSTPAAMSMNAEDRKRYEAFLIKQQSK